jgi:hypothetical protein
VELTAMRFIIMHKTSAHWEAGATPTPELIARVGAMVGQLAKEKVLEGAEGLRPSAEGARVRFAGGARHVSYGPFERGNELPAGFSIVRARSLDDAIDWASRDAGTTDDAEIDIRPVTEPWDIGMGRKPADVTTRRYMVLRKATAATEAGAAPSPTARRQAAPAGESAGTTHILTETMRPSARGRRYATAQNGITVTDGPFTESKELIGGYVIVSAASLDEADRWARLYIDAVGPEEVDLRELDDAAGRG